MRESQHSGEQPSAIIVEHVRADAQGLLEKIKTTPDHTARRELARRAFQLAQIAAMEERPAWPAVRMPGRAGARKSRAVAVS